MTAIFKAPVRALAGLSMACMLSACGGGGGSGDGNFPPPTPPAALLFLTSELADAVVNVPYNQTLRVSGGTGARTFTVTTGDLPDGLALNQSTGVISGSPAGPAGTEDFTVTVVDSGSPPLDAAEPFSITINATSLGRNNTIADATPLGNGTYSASISPSGDPNGILAPDEDYYAITTTAASTVTVDINAVSDGSPLDSVIEIVNSAGVQLASCVSPAFTSDCVHDDEDTGQGLLDSFLQVRVPADTTFFIHVVDWGSNARPDMRYELVISGVN
ncbi:MAG: Ig domain-containing protein [Steroidobacteraceae bacterium]